jgi:hypothetical protein
MTRKLLVGWLLTAAAAFGGPAVTSITFDNISHSDLRVLFNSTGTWNSVRLRYTASPATCTSGSGGYLQVPFGVNGAGGIQAANAGSGVVLSGLTPNTQYQACVELSADGGNTWTSGVGATVTTLPLPAVHPVPPTPPVTFDTSYPDTTGYSVYNVASDCHDLVSDWNTAIQNQMNTGAVINIPAGSVCSQNYPQYSHAQYGPSQLAPDAVTFASSAVSTSANTITIPNHGYSEGQGLIFGTNYSCLPGSSLDAYCNTSGRGPILRGSVYYAHVVDSNTIQIYANAPQASGGTLVTFSNQGSGSNIYVVKWPRPLKWIIVRTSTPDSQFAPQGTRVSPSWAPKMATLVNSLGALNSNVDSMLMPAGGDPGNVDLMAANTRFVGLELTYAQNPFAGTSSDPQPWYSLYWTSSTNENIIVDRCYFHGLGTPNRTETVVGYWDGKNVAIIDSYFDNMEYFHSMYTGLAISQTSSTSFTIAPGSANFGAGSGSLSSTATVTLSGSPSAQSRAYIYFTMTGNQLNIALPPGVTGTCSGVSNCYVYTASSSPTGHYVLGTTSGTFPSSAALTGYAVDPVFSTSASGTNPISPFQNVTTLDANWQLSSAYGGYQLGSNFVSDVNGYITGIRFYKAPGDVNSHVVTLWGGSGTNLATATSSNETASGWQTVNFASPAAITAGTTYVAAYYTANGGQVYYRLNGWQNNDQSNGTIHIPASYVGSNGSGNYSDSWPPDAQGRPAAGEIAYVDIATSGSIAALGNADITTSPFDPEGCQCLRAGIGPGPWMALRNYISAVGLPWHHDDSGWEWAIHGDYTYQRNTFHTPFSRMWGSPQSDGMRYFHRQPLEWKSGNRIQIYGNVFDGSWVEDNPTAATITLTSYLDNGITDVDVEDNTFQHLPGIMQPSGVSPSVSIPLQPPPGNRFLFRNNLAWDINGFNYCVSAGGFCNAGLPALGWIFQGPNSQEDVVIDHNTFVGNVGRAPVLMSAGGTRVEGVQVTNNILYVDGSYFGVVEQFGNMMLPQCLQNGEAAANCAYTPSYVWDHNVMIGNGATQSQIQSAWPNHTGNNYIPSNTNLSAVGWFKYQTPVLQNGNPQSLNFHLKANYCSGCNNPANDGRDEGADINALEAAQGKTTLIGAPASSISSSAATVAFVAPDSAGCPVDYSSSDPTLITNFTRISDPGGPRVRNISLSGLSSQTTYYYRVNCAVEQPTGQFRTN